MIGIRACAAAAAALTCLVAAQPAQAVVRQVLTINGFKVDRYTWTDSKGQPRSVSLKREGEGNTGHGGYAVQMTYKYLDSNIWKTLILNPPVSGEGFGYFVSHERYRNFTDGDYDTIAGKIFNKDDSPLGRGFAATSLILPTSDASRAVIQFRVNYPRYGTVAARPVNGNGEDTNLPPTASAYTLYQMPVRITWYFQDGKDYPRIRTQVSLENFPGPDRASFDVRGPYGDLKFDGNVDAAVKQVFWGDRFQFRTTTLPLTRNSTWTWNEKAAGRYTALTASRFEMGLMEPRTYLGTQLRDGYSGGRGKTSSAYNCLPDQRLPCDYEWPYQSAQYSLPYDNINGQTTGKKIAWGSSAFYGMSLGTVFDTDNTSQPFDGFPANGQIGYDVCVVTDLTVVGGTTRRASIGRGTYNCADGVRE